MTSFWISEGLTAVLYDQWPTFRRTADCRFRQLPVTAAPSPPRDRRTTATAAPPTATSEPTR